MVSWVRVRRSSAPKVLWRKHHGDSGANIITNKYHDTTIKRSGRYGIGGECHGRVPHVHMILVASDDKGDDNGSTCGQAHDTRHSLIAARSTGPKRSHDVRIRGIMVGPETGIGGKSREKRRRSGHGG